MSRSPLVSALAFAATFVASRALAAPPAESASLSPVFAAPAPPAAPPRPRTITPDTAARITAVVPKFVPQQRAAENSAPAEDNPSPADHPRNTIIRLPRYLVQEDKVPALKEREVLTPEGKLELALKRHPGLRFGSIGGLNNNAWARAMLEEEFALERAAEWADLMSLLPGQHRPMQLRATGWIPGTPASGPWAGLAVPWERR